jgi:fucose permease
MILVAPRSPRITARFGTSRVVAAGFLIQAIGFGIATTLDAGSGYAHLLLAVLPMALGMSLLMPPTTNAIVTSLPQDKAGVASAVNDTTREVGGAVGIALLGTLVTVNYQSAMTGPVEGLAPPLAAMAGDSIGGAIQAAAQLDPEAAALLVAAARNAYVDGTTIAFTVAGCLGLVMAAVIARFYPRDELVIEPAPAPAPAAAATAT